MNRKRILNIVLLVILAGAVVLFFVNPFRESDLAAWSEDVSYNEYQTAIDILEATLDTENQRNAYVEYLSEVELNYNLPETLSTITSDVSSEKDGYSSDVVDISVEKSGIFQVIVTESGYYEIAFDYKVVGQVLNNLTISIAIDDAFLYSDAKTIDVPLYWNDSTKDFGVDTYGDQTVPLQSRDTDWRTLDLYNNTYTTNEPLLFYFEVGSHKIEMENVSTGLLKVGNLTLQAPSYIPTYQEYISQYSTVADPFNVFVNATSYIEKNSSYVRLTSFSDPSVSPYDNVYKKLNAIDGEAWYKSGQEVTYEVDVEEDGLYDLTLHYANYKTDFDVFRSVKIDGEIPYQELASYSIPYTSSNWDNHTFSNDEGNDFQVYLTAGTHTITLRAEQSEIAQYLRDIQLMIDHINQFALNIIKITGKDIDKDRTWELTKTIPQTETYLSSYHVIIKRLVVELAQYSDIEDLSTTLAYLKNSEVEMQRMLEKPDELPLYLNNLYSGSSSVTLLLGDSLDNLGKQPLYLDGIYVSNDDLYEKANAGFFKRTWATISSFISTYTTDKFDIENDEEAIDVWVNRPITYVDIMQKMADSSFTEESGYKVNISVMPDANKLILANSAGNTPDVALGLSSFMPFDLAIRGAIQDLTEFPDYWEFANHFSPGALVPYILEDGVYAMPETLEFHALVYRKDVFHALDLEVPDTWDDVIGMLPTLQRYDMNFYYPTSGGTSLKWFYQTTPFIFQNGGTLYSEDGLSTTIDSDKSVEGLKLLGELYTTHSLPEQVPVFYNSFRYNKLPVGIIDFNTYMQLKTAAPELTGQWGIAPYPGIYNEDTDTVERWYVGNGTGGVMFKNSDNKDGAWEFMKWWMSTETQTDFAYTLQSTYGPAFLWLSGNLDAVEQSPLDNADKQIILEQFKWLRDVPRTPGQYMLERGLSDIWNKVTFDDVPVRVAIDRQVIIIDREIKRKMIEFGYLDSEGNVIKPYTIRDVDWIQEQMDKAGDN